MQLRDSELLESLREELGGNLDILMDLGNAFDNCEKN